MTPFGLSGLLIGITSVSFGLFVLLMSANRKIGRIWFLFTLAVGAWGFGGMWISWTKTATEALLAWRLAFAFGVVWISPVFYHFVCTFLDLRRKRSIALHYFITLVFLSTIPTSLFFSRVRWVFDSLYYVLGGALYPVYFAWWITLVLFSHYELIRAYHTASPGRKTQIKYFFFATAMGFSGGSMAYFPAFGIDIYPWGNFGIVLHPLIMSVAIVKHRLMDIELVARHTLTKLLAWGVIGLPFVIGMIMGHFLSSRAEFLYDRAPWDLLCAALNYSLALTLLRNYRDPLCDRLRWVFTLLGTWQLLTVVLLTSPPYRWSQVVYRSGYAVGAFLLLALFSFWEEFFQNAKDRFSTIVRHGLEWTVLAMAVFSVLTPWIIRGLAFDPSHRLAAREVPGPLYGIFAIWFVVSLVCMGLWSVQAIRRFPEETSRSQKTWIMASLISVTGAAVSYFLFVMKQISWHYYPPMVAVMCFCLTAALSHRMKRTAQPIDFRLGAMILVVPFAAGAMLAYSLVARGLAAFLLAAFAATIVKQSKGSIQALVDRLFKDKFRYLVEIERLGEDIYRRTNLSELLRGLARDLAERARMSWVGVWLMDITAGAFHLQRASGSASENDVPHHLWTTSFGAISPLIKRFEFDKTLLLSDETAQDEERDAAQELARWSIAAALPMYSGDKLLGFIGFGPKLRQEAFHSADITTLSDLGRKAERAIAQAYMLYEQAKMLAKLSHDILNFINPQTLAIQELAQRCGPVSADQKKHLKTLWKQKDLIEESIRDLLELERLVELRMEGKWRMREYRLGELAQASIAAYQAKAEGRGVVLEASLSPCPDGIGDPRSIRRVIDNLVINALKFTPTGGRILVQVEPAGANLRLTVSDTGAGIPAEDLPRIFDPFYQGSNYPGLAQGTGIGLSNVKEFVNLHKGSLRVDSELEHGTTFVIELPSVSRVQEFDAAMVDPETLARKVA